MQASFDRTARWPSDDFDCTRFLVYDRRSRSRTTPRGVDPDLLVPTLKHVFSRAKRWGGLPFPADFRLLLSILFNKSD